MMAGSIQQIALSKMSEDSYGPLECGGTVDLHDEGGLWLASFTLGASSVRLSGPERCFAEASAADSVTHSVWVRTMPEPFAGLVDLRWLRNAFAANEAGVPDILGIAMQYLEGAPPRYDGNMQIAGNAAYGPLKDGKREEGSDFNDYLGLTWSYPNGLTDFPERRQFRCLDCLGFIRMVWGFRRSMEGYGYTDSLPLSFDPDPPYAIPRRANEIFEAGPGVVIVENRRVRPKSYPDLAVGDLVFFNADKNDGPRLDHVGMYLGLDAGGSRRFISSRKKHNGPTLGDSNGASILDGNDNYARAFRCARRL